MSGQLQGEIKAEAFDKRELQFQELKGQVDEPD